MQISDSDSHTLTATLVVSLGVHCGQPCSNASLLCNMHQPLAPEKGWQGQRANSTDAEAWVLMTNSSKGSEQTINEVKYDLRSMLGLGLEQVRVKGSLRKMHALLLLLHHSQPGCQTKQ